jgi:predicted  nucleic acid-binding Zn-ribbon protein
MAEQNNNPIGGNYNSNNTNIDTVITVVEHLATTQDELIKGLRSISKKMDDIRNDSKNNNKNRSSNNVNINNINQIKKAITDALKNNRGTGNNSNNPTQSNVEKKKEQDKKLLTEAQIKNLKALSHAYEKGSDELNKLADKLADSSKSFKNIPNELKTYVSDLQNILKEEQKYKRKQEANFKRELASYNHEIQLRQSEIHKLEVQQKSATNERKLIIQNEIDAKQKEIDDLERTAVLVHDRYNKIQDVTEQSAQFYVNSVNNLNKALADRESIEKQTTDLLKKSSIGFHEKIDKFKEALNPKLSESYKATIKSMDDTDAETIKRLELIEEEKQQSEETINLATNAIHDLDKAIVDFEQVINEAGANASAEDKQRLKQLEDRRKARAEDIEKAKLAQKNLKQEENVLKGNIEANKKLKETFDKQNNIFSRLGDKLGETITKYLTKYADRQLDLLRSAADSAFDAIESTQKSLGKTLKMSTGAYQEYVDKVQEAAKEAGVAISQNQVLELSATMAEMGLRDENLIKTFALEQAKMQEAGVGSIVQLNEDTIRMYKNTYNDLIRSGLTEDQASKVLTEQLDRLIAIESTVADEFGNVDALANGGFTEIQNLTNQLIKSGNLNAEQREEFEYQLARGMQTIAETGADPSNFLSDIQTLLTSTESNLSPELLSILSGNTASTIDQFSNATVDMINRYLQQNKSIYGNLNLTDAKYVAEAYGASGTVQDKMALAKAGQLQGKKLEALDTNTKKIQKDLQEGTYLTATEKMEKKRLEVMQDIAQMMQKIPDGKFWMDTGLDASRTWLSSLASLIASFIGSGASAIVGKLGRGGLSTNQGGTPTPNNGGGGESGWATAAKALTSVGGLGLASYSFGKSLYSGESLEDALTDDTFTSGLGMAIGGAVAGPLGGLFGAAVAKYGVPEMRKGTTALFERAFGGTDDLAQESFELMTEAGEDLKNSANTLYDSANKQLEALQKEEAEMTKFSTIQKRDWLQQKEQELKTMGILKPEESIGDLSNAKSIDEAFKKYSEKYKDVKSSDITTAMGSAELTSTLSNIYGSRTNLTSDSAFKTASGYNSSDLLQLKQTGKITEEQFQEGMQEIYKQEGNQLLTAMSEYEGSAQGFSNTIASYMATGLTKEEAISKYATEANMTDRQASQLLGAYSTLEERKARYEKINKLFQDTYKQAHSNAGSDNTLAIEQAFASLSPIDISATMIKGTPKKSIDVEDLKNSLINGTTTFASVDTFSDVPVLNTVNGTYAGYKTGLDYVPYDNYLALLHRGEKVLNESEAQSYRTDTTVSFDSINNTLVAQTDRIENILKQIYNVILYMGKGSNTSSLNPNIVNMVSGIATM